eukprot:scaffold21549_cov38-Phaeocystis_antarctica.AAC.1
MGSACAAATAAAAALASLAAAASASAASAALAALAADAPLLLVGGSRVLNPSPRLIVLGSAAAAAGVVKLIGAVKLSVLGSAAAAGAGDRQGCQAPVASSPASRLEATRDDRLQASRGDAGVGRCGSRILARTSVGVLELKFQGSAREGVASEPSTNRKWEPKHTPRQFCAARGQQQPGRKNQNFKSQLVA